MLFAASDESHGAELWKSDGAVAGTVLVKINRFEQGVTVFAQATSLDGEPSWSRGTGPKPVTEAEADAYIERQVKFDPDVWVLEIEDRKGQYKLDGKIV